MRITELQGRLVVDRATARTFGTIVDVRVDPTAARIVALEAASPGRPDRLRIPAEWITRVGSHAVMVARRAGAEHAETVTVAEDCLNYQTLVGLEVLNEAGDRIGYLQDAGIEAEGLAITRFEIVGTGWHRWLDLRTDIQTDAVAFWNRDVMLIRARGHASALDPIGLSHRASHDELGG